MNEYRRNVNVDKVVKKHNEKVNKIDNLQEKATERTRGAR